MLCLRKVSVIYLEQMSPFVSSNLPPDIGRATLHASVYMILQPIRRTASYVTIQTGELLPHLFTLTLFRKKTEFQRLFSVTLLCSHKQLPVRKYGALCCPDFPHFILKCDKPTCYFSAKIKRKFQNCFCFLNT